MARTGALRLVWVLAAAAAVAGCEEGAGFGPFAGAGTDAAPQIGQTRLAPAVERDVEAPDVFHRTESALWDGRPSLGGVWVAHPSVTEPERVIMRNLANGKSVIGALFRRERENPGPRFQVSSDAANALEMLAGQPTELSVTAMRLEQLQPEPEISDLPDAAVEAAVDTAEIATVPLAAAVRPLARPTVVPKVTPKPTQPSTTDPVAALAASAIETATAGTTATTTNADQPSESIALIAPTQPTSLAKPYIQIGIYNEEANANATSDKLRRAGMIPIIKKSENNGQPFWRVLVGPSADGAERTALLTAIRGLGFADAYAVTN